MPVSALSAKMDYTSSRLTRRFHTMGMEDLNAQAMVKKDMVKNRHLTRALADIGFFECHRQLAYKARWRGGMVGVADRWFTSSKTCSDCAHQLESLPLSMREWTCPNRNSRNCNSRHDRDVNVARNLKHMAVSATVSVCGEDGALARLAKVR